MGQSLSVLVVGQGLVVVIGMNISWNVTGLGEREKSFAVRDWLSLHKVEVKPNCKILQCDILSPLAIFVSMNVNFRRLQVGVEAMF